jgi:DNA-binding FadR family transcriptional regulator
MLENGYAVSIVVLAVFVVESAVNRTRYVRNEHKTESAVDTLKRLGADDLASDVEELFVIRDVIAHNHVWLAATRWDESAGMALDAAEKLVAYGDQKFSRVVNLTTRLTRRLGLDSFPNRIHRATAVVVLKKMVQTLKFLEALDRRYVYLSQPWHVTRGKRLVAFYDWVDTL